MPTMTDAEVSPKVSPSFKEKKRRRHPAPLFFPGSFDPRREAPATPGDTGDTLKITDDANGYPHQHQQPNTITTPTTNHANNMGTTSVINLRLSADLIAAIDRIAQAEALRTGYPVSRPDWIRAALARAVQEHEKASKGGKQ